MHFKFQADKACTILILTMALIARRHTANSSIPDAALDNQAQSAVCSRASHD